MTEARGLARQPLHGARIDARFRLARYEAIDSTNTEAKRRAAAGEPEFTVVLAGEQTAGHGRRGRAWDSPRGNLYSSTILRPGCTPLIGAQVSFVAALAVHDVARALLPPSAGIACKWPNDVLVDGRKVAGILLESSATAGVLDWLVLGVGINVAHHPGVGGAYPSTSLSEAGAGTPDLEAVLALYLDALARWYGRWRAEGFAPVRAAWRERALGLAAPVTVRLEREPLEGRFVDLDETGALVLELASGARRVIAAGEVFFGAGSGHAARD